MPITVPVSTVPTVKAYLFTALAGRTELTSTNVLVSYDAPGTNMPDDIVWLGDVTRRVGSLAMVGDGGQGSMEETYVLTTAASVYRGGDQAKTTFERACALADVIVDVVRQDLSLGGLVVQAMPGDISYESEWVTQELDDGNELHMGRITTVTVALDVYAQI